MTEAKFRRIHPDTDLGIVEQPGCLIVVGTIGKDFAIRRTGRLSVGAKAFERTRLTERLIREVSDAVGAIQRRQLAAQQDWRDAQTGAIVPLEFHHIVKRSKGRLDSPSNLSGLGAESHRLHHEKK